MEKNLSHKGFQISWQEPPHTGAGWMMNVAGSTPELKARLEAAEGRQGAKVIVAQSRDAGIAEATAFIDSLLT
ncbi:MAG TPA: hypothetical protein VHX61_14580 [Rhizomicrobium sp.]|jgi:hypothetical protein|nr:hypothetical protein [Rhizomicrobium sp.]